MPTTLPHRSHRPTSRFLAALFLPAVLGACGEPSATPDGGEVHDTAEAVEAADTPDDGDTGTDTGGCEASATLEPGGGTYTLCGARLRVPPESAPTAPTTVSVVRRPDDATHSCLLESAGDRFDFSAASPPFRGLVELALPHQGLRGRRCLPFVLTDEGWSGMEPCSVTDDEAVFVTGGLAPYTVLRETRTYPSSPSGLGSGSVVVTFEGADRDLDLDAPSGQAIHTEDCDGRRSVDLQACDPGAAPEDCIPTPFRAVFSVDPAAGTGSVLWVRYLDWEWLEPFHPEPATVTGITVAGDRIRATLAATLHRADAVAPVTVALDVSSEAFAYPPEASCLP